MSKKTKKLKKRIKELERVVKKHSLTITDPLNENVKIILSVLNGEFSTDRVITEVSTVKENITNQN